MKWVAVVLLSLLAMGGLGIALLASLVRSVSPGEMNRKVVVVGMATSIVAAALAVGIIHS